MSSETANEAARLTQDSIVVEAHRDCYEQIHWLNMGEDNPVRDRLIPRLRAGGVDVVVYAVGGDTLAHSNGRDKKLLATLDNIHDLNRACGAGSDASVVRNRDDLDVSSGDGQVRFLLHLEGGTPLEGSLGALESLYALGVRSIQPTWNIRNELGDGVHERDTRSGLTRFGRAAVQRMQELGILVDLAHISESGFWSAIDITTGPVVVSHANSRAIYDHPRNLTDEQVRAIAERGGVVGVHTLPTFVGSDSPTIEKLVDHVEHLVDVAGIDHVAFGGDFVREDGPRPGREQLFHDPRKTPPVIPGLSEADELANLTHVLLDRGFDHGHVAALLGSNMMRVLGQVLPRN